jgi:DNA-binding response OmpR family regulator
MKNPKCLVLVVEDDSLIAFDTGAQIEQALAVSVVCHRFDEEALDELLRTGPPDLMLIDLCPWQHDRLAIVRLAQACGVSVVIGTVLDEARNGIAGLRDVPVLVKPYDPVRLVETVESRLAAIHPCRGLTEQMPAL